MLATCYLVLSPIIFYIMLGISVSYESRLILETNTVREVSEILSLKDLDNQAQNNDDFRGQYQTRLLLVQAHISGLIHVTRVPLVPLEVPFA
ncbi:hypothetical protein IMZ48_18240 [Candidatus Bathyarchaeota archaeon]|nr:hypothetical protein [Candidatus Bathyarchaeota archaeon]